MEEQEAITRLERRLAAAGIERAGAALQPDATLRPVSKVAPPLEPPATTEPFLPSITLSEPGAAGSSSARPDADLLVSATLGAGGMGIVQLASQRSLERDVAIKRPLLEDGGALVIAEARTMARVEHPNVVPVHALGLDREGRPVLVMKRVSGASLRELLRDEAHALWPLLEARWGDRQSACLGILAEVADALGHAHARGIVHRDVKPENVMVGEFGEVYLLDWGIACIAGEPAPDPDGAGAVVGTPGYMAPEMVLDPGSCDARTDVYLLGATLHQILTGTLRHRGSTIAAVIFAAMESKPFAYGDDVAEDLAALANAATHRDRDERPASAAEFRRALLQHERHKEALGLVRAAREALAPLRDGTMRVADPGAEARLFEARSLLAAAARAHPESARVAAARGECLALHVERDLAIESPSSARALLAELPAPRPDFEEAIAALEERLARAKASDEALRRARAEADTSSALRARSLLLLATVLPMLLVAVALPLGLAGDRAEVSVETIAWTNLAALATVALGALLGRRRLFATRGNRLLTWYGLVGLVPVVGIGFGALAFDASPRAALAAAHAAVAAYTSAGALTIGRELASVACCSAIFGVLFVALPEATGVLSPLGLVGVIATSVASVAAHAARGRAES